jgi:HAE1 family hydrophobic/amphiphilic exporter-1
MATFVLSLGIYPLIGLAFFPAHGRRPVHHQPEGAHRLAHRSDQRLRGKVEDLIKKTIAPADFHMTVSNIGVTPDFSALYTVELRRLHGDHSDPAQPTSTNRQLRIYGRGTARLNQQYPELRTFFQSGSMVDAIINTGMPAPDRYSGQQPGHPGDYRLAREIASKVAALPETGRSTFRRTWIIPGIRMDVNRVHAAELGLTQKDVVDNVITALNSNVMIAPNYWVDRKTGNNYFLTVQYYEHGSGSIRDPLDLTNIPCARPT